MSKKILISVIALIAMFGASLPVAAQEAEEEEKEKPPVVVPNHVEISDPPGDANYRPGDWQTGNIGPSGSDILKVWFTNDESSISAHLLTSEPMNETALYYSVRARAESLSNPVCVVFHTWIPGNGGIGDSARVDDTCGDEALRGDGEATVEEGPDGTAIVTITVPRNSSPRFEEDAILFAPTADSRHHFANASIQIIDGTNAGADYTVVGKLVAPEPEEPEEGEEGEEPEEEPEEEEPEQSEPPKKKKGKKGKGCPAYVPGEQGAEAETTVVTEEATEEKPIEVPIEAPAGVPEVGVDHVFHNVQVDTAGGATGLFLRYEFPIHEDLDLYLRDAAGEQLARAAGFNQAPVGPLNDTAEGGHSEMGAEQIDGYVSNDCDGFTVDMASFISSGGEMTLKLWLADPEAEEEGMRTIYDSVMSLM